MGGKSVSVILRSVTIYSMRGEHRTITFRSSGLNVLTGQSMTGKSSVIDMIDYCFGRSECFVADGVIRQHVSWFGVEIENNGDVLFVGRRNPGPGKRTSADIFLRHGRYATPPEYSDLSKNTTPDSLIGRLTRFAGITENEHRPVGGTRQPLQATIRHALFMCFQRQDEIASRERLFHRQGEQFIPQAIKDTIPYFLGAVDEEHFLRLKELDDAKKSLRELEGQRSSMESGRKRALGRIRQFVLEARRVGLVDEAFEPVDVELGLEALKRATEMNLASPRIVSAGGEVIRRLEGEIHTLNEKLRDVQDVIRTTRHFLREHDRYSREAGEQRERLASIHLYTGTLEDGEICPVCETELMTPTPKVADLAASLRVLDERLDVAGGERPYLRERLDKYGKLRTEVENSIVARQRDLERAYTDDARARRLRSEVVDRARVMGRIAAFLEQVDVTDETGEIDAKIEAGRRRVNMLLEHVRGDEVEERVYTFVNLIADRMTRYASNLDLEHTEGRLRLDLKKLSVVAETPTGPIPLYRIGSAENWVGYHVVTLLALHDWFRKRHRPVPAFLVLDQPSQAHYPPEADGSVTSIEDDADRQAVRKLFRLMHDESNAIGDGFQLIVLDHAHIDEKWFDAAIVEEWRDGRALVPEEWIVTQSGSDIRDR